MTLPSSYKSGSISVQPGTVTVTGAGTNWLGAGIQAGDILWSGGLDVAVASVLSPTQLVLAYPWTGPALTGAVYEIRYTADATRVLAASREAIASLEAARAELYASADVYPSTADGLAATTAGQQFQVATGNEIVRYRHDAGGVATELARYLTGPGVAQTVGDAVQHVDQVALGMATLVDDLVGPTATQLDVSTGHHALWLDRTGKTLMALTPSGLHFQMSDELAVASAPRLAEAMGVGTPATAPEVMEGWSLIEDRSGKTIMQLAADGLDFRVSSQLIGRIRTGLALEEADPLAGVDPQYVTLTICLTQSLLFMNSDSDAAPLYPDVDPLTALMIGGLRRSDGVALTMAGPGSMSYDTATHGTGFVSPDPAPADPSGAYYAAKGYNGWRRKYGLVQRRNVGTLWGQAGDHITRYNAILGDSPTAFPDTTTHWDNLMFWLDEACRIAGDLGLIPRVDLYAIQGTSSKQDADPLLHAATLRNLIVALRAQFDQRGIEDAAVYFSQPGGDTDTSPGIEHWHVTQSYLDLAEQGYGVLVAPESYVRIFDNNVHFGEISGEQLLGMLNWARAAREAGRDWTIRKPVVSRTGNVVTLDYTSLWDGEMIEVEPDRYAGQGIDQWLGYSCDTATITGLEIVGRQVRLTFDAVPLWIDYMLQMQDVRAIDDGYTAFRGRLVTTSRMRDPLNPNIVHRRRLPSHGVAVPQ